MRGTEEAGFPRAEAALAELEARRAELLPGTLSVDVLDGLGWQLQRSGRGESAALILRHNRELFPGDYAPLDSVAFITFDSGEREAAFEMLERWLEEHPDHARARRLLTNLRARSE